MNHRVDWDKIPHKKDIGKQDMKLYELRTNLNMPFSEGLPFGIYTVGTEQQAPITRFRGFSAKQIILTFSGSGAFRKIGHDNWDIITAGKMLYIPAGLPHQYVPMAGEPWQVGYVTFVDGPKGGLQSWGYGDHLHIAALAETERLFSLIEQIWRCSGPDYDLWRSAELFLQFCVELKKQTVTVAGKQLFHQLPSPDRHPSTMVDRMTRFLHDHLERNFTMSELSSYVGYSAKQTVRLFRQQHGMTPHQYLQKIRLQTAAQLLQDHPDMTIGQIAAHVGMEPVYFSRQFSRLYGVVPSAFRSRGNKRP
ncbi:AraC family transcriptional regulator [Paenibacillus caui]|uniref:AraC family transcriptional regulator n=1 Tax=Paenibacillus caui TaxID=2873927 RepID=UPI003080697D